MADEEFTALNDRLVREDFTNLTNVICASCGITFGMPTVLREKRQENHKRFYCPNGHGNYYPPPPKSRDEELEELCATVEQLEHELAQSLKELMFEREEHSRTKQKKRGWFR